MQPVIVGTTLCIGYYDGKLFALNTADGSVRWSYQTGGPILHTPAMDTSRVYFGSYDGKLYAMNLSDGSFAWSVDTGSPIQAAPCLSGSNIYIGNIAGNLYCITTAGVTSWTYPSGRPILTSACADGNNTVYCGNEGVYAFAVNTTNGQQRWKVRLKGQSMFASWPVVVDSQAVVFFRTEPLNVFHRDPRPGRYRPG